MEPVSPVLPHSEPIELRVAENQEQYLTLPSVTTEHTNISRWRLSDKERQYIAGGGDLFVAQLCGKSKLQPVMLLAMPEDEVLTTILKAEEHIGLK